LRQQVLSFQPKISILRKTRRPQKRILIIYRSKLLQQMGGGAEQTNAICQTHEAT